MKINSIALLAAALAVGTPALAATPAVEATHTYQNGEYGSVVPTTFVTLAAGWYDLTVTLSSWNGWFASASALLQNEAGTAISSATTGTTTSVPTNTQTTHFQLLTGGKYGFAFNGGSFGASATANATLTATPVPGPEAGAGVGALALGGMALYLKRRRKDEVAAA